MVATSLQLRTRAKGPFLAETQALIARFTTPPTTERSVLINNLIGSLITAGVWTKLDALYVTAQYDAQAAQQNWVQNAYNLTPVSSPTFTADRGYTGNGSSSYLSTGLDITAAGLEFVRNSAHFSAWLRLNIASNTEVVVGLATLGNVLLRPRRASTQVARAQLNTGASQDFNLPVATSVGLTMVSRTGAGATAAYKDGASLGTNTQASTALSSDTILLLSGAGGNYSTNQIATASIGGGLTSGEATAFYTAVNTYLVAVGAA